jgi:hypothetical protein
MIHTQKFVSKAALVARAGRLLVQHVNYRALLYSLVPQIECVTTAHVVNAQVGRWKRLKQ